LFGFNTEIAESSLPAARIRDHHVRELVEAELYLRENAQALGEESYAEFLAIETVVEDLAK
jgi:hypothetical protein